MANSEFETPEKPTVRRPIQNNDSDINVRYAQDDTLRSNQRMEQDRGTTRENKSSSSLIAGVIIGIAFLLTFVFMYASPVGVSPVPAQNSAVNTTAPASNATRVNAPGTTAPAATGNSTAEVLP